MGSNMKCINHPNRDAFLRCNQCWKPLCNDCVLRSNDGVYCSPECAHKGEEFKIKAAQNTSRSSLYWKFRTLRKFAIGVTLGVVILYILWIWGPEPIPSILSSIMDRIFG